MAYAVQRPWHSLGSKLAPKQSIEPWKLQAGMGYRIEESKFRYSSTASLLSVSSALKFF